MNNTYKIYPKQGSTGIWRYSVKWKNVLSTYYGSDVSFELPDYVPESKRIALKYWHDTWELFIADDCEISRKTQNHIDEWYNTGKRLVDELNLLSDDVYIYKATRH